MEARFGGRNAARQGAARIVRVSEDEVAEAIRVCYTDTHSPRAPEPHRLPL